jgi:hypothetical protein
MGVSVPWYQEWIAPRALRCYLACSWAGQAGTDGTGYADRVLPDGCVDIVWADAGYADQAHLTRECGRLAGTTPSRLRIERGRRNVQDREPSVLAGLGPA